MSIFEHLSHVLASNGMGEEDASASAAALVANPGDPDVVAKVTAVIGDHALAELLDAWKPYPSRTVHLWKNLRAPAKLKSIADDARKAAGRNVGKAVVDGEWVDATKRPKKLEFGRVRKLRIDDESVEALVSLAKTLRLTHDDEEEPPTHEHTSWTIHVELQKAFPKVIRTYGPSGDSRKALSLWMEWLHNVPQIRDAKSRAEYFEPLRFSEASAKKLANKLKMAQVWINGSDPTGLNGKYNIRSKYEQERFVPLDTSDPVVAAQDAAARDGRTFEYEFKHADGFREYVLLSFFFTASPPHISFPYGGSRPAIERLVSEVVGICEV